MASWGLDEGHLTRSWFVKTKTKTAALRRQTAVQRDRRVDADEERRLLECAPPFLQRLIIAALETCGRAAELLGLRWRDVSLERREFVVRPSSNKVGKARTLPVSPALHAVLLHLRNGPTGQPHGPEAYVFGDLVGGYMALPQKAWELCTLRAHGHTPQRSRTKGLSPASRAALAVIDLHFHDLRHEAGSRLLEAGWPLHEIQNMLGHGSLAQTSLYLNATKHGLHDSMRRFGTRPTPNLQKLAKQPDGDHPPALQTATKGGAQVTVN